MAVSQENERGWFLLQVGSWHIKWSKVDGMRGLFQNEAERTNVILREAFGLRLRFQTRCLRFCILGSGSSRPAQWFLIHLVCFTPELASQICMLSTQLLQNLLRNLSFKQVVVMIFFFFATLTPYFTPDSLRYGYKSQIRLRALTELSLNS